MCFASLLAVMLLASSLWGQTCSGSRYGAGPDIPCNITGDGLSLPQSGTAVQLPAYSGSYNEAQICWDTNTSSDSLLEIDWSAYTVVSPATQRMFYNSAMVTHHCFGFVAGMINCTPLDCPLPAGAIDQWLSVLAHRNGEVPPEPPDKIEPFPAGDFPYWGDASHNPHAISITSSGATIQWYSFEATTATQVKYGLSYSSLGAPTICGAGSFVSGSDTLWLNSCAISGLSPSTNYTFGVGATDAAGNVSFETISPDSSSSYFNFTTLPASSSPTLINGALMNGVLISP
jgi:hypothetical protein